MTEMVWIPPFSMLEVAGKKKYQLMLPHLLNSPAYHEFMVRMSFDPYKYVILDNGANEGVDVSFEQLAAIARHYAVDELVLPDVMGDYSLTEQRAEEFISASRYLLPHSTRLGFVLHGSSVDDVIINFAILRRQKLFLSVDVIYLPRMLGKGDELTARVEIAKQIRPMLQHKPIHFLGAVPEFVAEGMTIRREVPWVRSMDTSAPFVYALRHKPIDGGEVLRRDHSSYFSSRMNPIERQLAIANCEMMNRWISGQETSIR